MEHKISKPLDINKDVRQGCILTPTLFNLYSGCTFRGAVQDIEIGVSIEDQVINNLRNDDDTTLLADNENNNDL